jgi:hypothetical protein
MNNAQVMDFGNPNQNALNRYASMLGETARLDTRSLKKNAQHILDGLNPLGAKESFAVFGAALTPVAKGKEHQMAWEAKIGKSLGLAATVAAVLPFPGAPVLAATAAVVGAALELSANRPGAPKAKDDKSTLDL